MFISVSVKGRSWNWTARPGYTWFGLSAVAETSIVISDWSVVISGDGWFYDFGDSNRAFKRDCTVYTGY